MKSETRKRGWPNDPGVPRTLRRPARPIGVPIDFGRGPKSARCGRWPRSAVGTLVPIDERLWQPRRRRLFVLIIRQLLHVRAILFHDANLTIGLIRAEALVFPSSSRAGERNPLSVR
jgi:hypothetical protein